MTSIAETKSAMPKWNYPHLVVRVPQAHARGLEPQIGPWHVLVNGELFETTALDVHIRPEGLAATLYFRPRFFTLNPPYDPPLGDSPYEHAPGDPPKIEVWMDPGGRVSRHCIVNGEHWPVTKVSTTLSARGDDVVVVTCTVAGIEWIEDAG